MVDNGKAQIAQEVAEVCDELVVLLAKVQHIVNRAMDTGVVDEVNALPNDTDPVPETAFDKATFSNAVYGLQQFMQYMGNEPVAQGPYRQTLNKAAVLK